MMGEELKNKTKPITSGQRKLVTPGNRMLSVDNQENQYPFCSPDPATNKNEGPILPW